MVTTMQQINENMRQILKSHILIELTVSGLGSRMRLINFFAPEENHGGQETFAWQICDRKSKKSSSKLPLHFTGKPRS